jgi:hypothetical protein
VRDLLALLLVLTACGSGEDLKPIPNPSRIPWKVRGLSPAQVYERYGPPCFKYDGDKEGGTWTYGVGYCLSVSPEGHFIVQDRCSPCSTHFDIPFSKRQAGGYVVFNAWIAVEE